LFGFDFIYDPKVMQGDYIFRSSISMNGKEVSKNKFELVFE
jgi:hypothetical protein